MFWSRCANKQQRLHNNRINIKYETTILSNRLMGFFSYFGCFSSCLSLGVGSFFVRSSSSPLFMLAMVFSSLLFFFLFLCRLACAALFPTFSIKEMELFARWSAKVWALWIVIIQLAATECLIPRSGLSSVRIVRIMWVSLFTFDYLPHKKSQLLEQIQAAYSVRSKNV